jgi:DNA-binding PadR family transcriptional regulator
MYELIVLGQLARSPRHGYLIAKVVSDIIGPCRRVQWGALYPILNRLEQEGLIRAADEGVPEEGRPRKVYAITARGRERLHELLMDTTRHLGEYDSVFAHKVGLFSQLEPDERRYLIRHYLVYAQQHVDHLEHESRDLRERAAHGEVLQVDDILVVMAHRIDYWKRERAWAEELLARQSTSSLHQSKETA